MTFRSAFLVALSLAVPLARAEDFKWGEYGTFTVDVPAGWKLTGTALGNGVGYLFTGEPSPGAAASLHIAIAAPPPGMPITEKDVEQALRPIVRPYVATSVEKTYSPQPLRLRQGFGTYAQFTDPDLVGKAPVPGNYKMMRIGLAVLSPQAVAIGTMQFDEADQPETAEMLSLYGSLRFTSTGKAPPVAEDPSVLRIKKTGTVFELSVPVSRLMLRIPAQGLVMSTTRVGGSTDNPRYFELMRSSPNLIISGWFESADGFKGIKEFWTSESSALTRSGLPAIMNVNFLNVGSWKVVSYELRVSDSGNIVNANLRAELVQAGTWIDLHLSVTGPLSAQAARDQMIAAVKSMVVTEFPPSPP